MSNGTDSVIPVAKEWQEAERELAPRLTWKPARARPKRRRAPAASRKQTGLKGIDDDDDDDASDAAGNSSSSDDDEDICPMPRTGAQPGGRFQLPQPPFTIGAGATALHIAAAIGDKEICKLLITAGAKAGAADKARSASLSVQCVRCFDW